MAETPSLQLFDYFVTVAVLAVPVVIGIAYAVRDKKKMTRLEYLFGGQQMTLIPVTMSMFVTFQSAISVIGIPTEVYRYGSGVIYFYIGILLCLLLLYFFFAPLIYPLEITSIYEYLLLRFQSQAVRMLSTVIGCVHTIIYLSITLLAPALALQAVTGGIPMWMSILVVGGIGTIYTVIGGIKSVIWTDVFQTVIVFVGILAIIIKGSIAVGGLDKAWSIANDGGRIKFDEFRLDPRVRMSFWGAVLGSMVSWMSTAFNQSTLQRIRALKSLRDAKMTNIVCIPFHISYGIVLVLVGIVTYAYFWHIRCDPLKGGLVQNANQIVPYFVIHAMEDLPGMPGLYMATLFCGSLSTLSSGINALAANTVEDFLERPLKKVSERTATLVTKIAAAVHGILVCCLGYGAQYLDGSVIQMSVTALGALGPPVLGMFLMGCVVPWANKYGAMSGALVSLAFILWIGIGSRLHGQSITALPAAAIDRCSYLNSTISSDFSNPTLSSGDNLDKKSYNNVINGTLYGNTDSNGFGFFLYDISFEWYTCYGLLVCLIVGLVVSFCTRDKRWRQVSFNPNLLFPICRRFWNLESGQQSNEFFNNKADNDTECKELI